MGHILRQFLFVEDKKISGFQTTIGKIFREFSVRKISKNFTKILPKPTLYTITRAVSRGTNLQKKCNMFWVPKKQSFNIHQICLCTVKSTGIVISWFFGSKSRISNFHKNFFFTNRSLIFKPKSYRRNLIQSAWIYA